MRRHLLLALALGVAALSPARADMISFNIAQTGSTPSDFDVQRTGDGGPAQWILVRDETAQGGLALEQASRDKADYRFPLAIYKPFSGANVEVRVRFKPVAGAVDRAGGIAVRLTTPDDYYVVRANALEDNVRFYRVVKGRREQLESASLKVSANEWHTLALKAEGDRFTISFDGKPLYTVSDKTFSKEGKVALWTKSDSVTRFDSIDINPLP
jgi:hypothetical protein